MLIPEPVELVGKLVRLEPLTVSHLDALWQAANHPQLWNYSLLPMATFSDVESYVHQALAAQAAGSALPFVQIEQQGGGIVGSTRFGNIDVFNRTVEIGWTWLTPSWQRSGINTEAKLLLLSHAFEALGALRVTFKGDANNQQSRRALERIGAVFEGVLRQHMRKADGGQRDSFHYSIVASEWPMTKARIEGLLARPRP